MRLFKKYILPENKINPQVKVAIQENTLKQDDRLSKIQEALTAVISALRLPMMPYACFITFFIMNQFHAGSFCY
nr:unnamed protein product [Callosobruchus chinensis]